MSENNNDSSSTLERLNAERINHLDEKIDRLITDLPTIVQSAVGHAIKSRPNEGQAWARQSIGLTIAVITIIGFTFTTFKGFIEPVQLQIEYLREDKEELKNSLEKHETFGAHSEARADIASIKERFAEVETQFRNIDERTFRMEKVEASSFSHLESKLESSIQGNLKVFDQRIKAMERTIFSQEDLHGGTP